MNLSLDGYIAAPGDELGWSVPSDELFQWWSDRVGAMGLASHRLDRHRAEAEQVAPGSAEEYRGGPRSAAQCSDRNWDTTDWLE